MVLWCFLEGRFMRIKDPVWVLCLLFCVFVPSCSKKRNEPQIIYVPVAHSPVISTSPAKPKSPNNPTRTKYYPPKIDEPKIHKTRKTHTGDLHYLEISQINAFNIEEFFHDEIYGFLNIKVYSESRNKVAEKTFRWPSKPCIDLGNGETVIHDLPNFEIKVPPHGYFTGVLVLMERDSYSNWVKYSNAISSILGFSTIFLSNPYTASIVGGSALAIQAAGMAVEAVDALDDDDQLGTRNFKSQGGQSKIFIFEINDTNLGNSYKYQIKLESNFKYAIFEEIPSKGSIKCTKCIEPPIN